MFISPDNQYDNFVHIPSTVNNPQLIIFSLTSYQQRKLEDKKAQFMNKSTASEEEEKLYKYFILLKRLRILVY